MAAPAEQYDHLLSQSTQHPRFEQRPNEQYSQQQRPQTKPRSFSVRSGKSHRSGGSKSELHEAKGHLQSKADPSMAINEAEPGTFSVSPYVMQPPWPPLNASAANPSPSHHGNYGAVE